MRDPMIGRAIGNYVVQSRVGDGGMGVVYVATHPRLGRQVAIKVLHPGSEEHPERVARFFNEARAAHEIKNEHIVEILDFGDLPEGRPYLTMEWLEGRSLSSLVANGRGVPWPRAFHIVVGIADALNGAHAADIIHRDLKPDNVFLITRGDDRDFVKVLDFGIAKISHGFIDGSMKTATGQVMGTPAYMAPEQCRGDATIDHRADLYALAVITYQLVSGRLPFNAEGCGSLLVKQILDPPPPIRSQIPEFPAELDAVILRALEKNPDDRYAGVMDFVGALAAAAAGHEQTLDRAAAPGPEALSRPMHQPSGETWSPGPEDKDHSSLGTLGDAAVEIPYEHKFGKPLLIGGLVVVAAAGGYMLFSSRVKLGPTPVQAPAASLPTTLPPTATPPPPAPIAPIHVRIAAEPREASLLLDGQPVPNPFAHEQAPQAGEHTLTIKATGRREETRTIVFDRDIDLAVTLETAPVAPAAPSEKRLSGESKARRGRPHDPSVGAAHAYPTLAPEPAPTPAAAPSSGKSVYRGTRLPLDSEF